MQNTSGRWGWSRWSECLSKWTSHRSHLIRRGPSSGPIQLQLLWLEAYILISWARVLSIARGQFQWHIRGSTGHWNREATASSSIVFNVVRVLEWSWPIIEEMPQHMATTSTWSAIPTHMIFVFILGPRGTTLWGPQQDTKNIIKLGLFIVSQLTTVPKIYKLWSLSNTRTTSFLNLV